MNASVSVLPNVSGDYVYQVTGSSNGCTSTDQVKIKVADLPVIKINPGDSSICSGSQVVLKASGASTYNWSPAIRNLIRSNNANHPWLAVDDKQLLEMAGLWRRDFTSGLEGYTLAAALLLGKDEVIRQILPIDALVRIHNVDRYDDREYIQTNLIEAYEQLMAFVAKHLPDKFYMEGDQRVSLRTKIFREIVAYLIVHREYTNAQPCTFIIYKDRMETANANNRMAKVLLIPKTSHHFQRILPFPNSLSS